VLTADNPVCKVTLPSTSNTEIISVRQAPVISFNTPDTIVLANQQVVLNALVTNDVLSYTWTPSDKLIDPSSLSPTTIALSQMTVYTLDVVSTNGCKASKDFVVKIFGKFNMPNAFTPNGDGKNDVFRIPPNTFFKLKDFSVFNRWGEKIFSTNNPGKGWDGTYKGLPCNVGAYVFMISGSNEKEEVFLKGTVMLIR
jgi:gliding motility-associated-like protein